MFADRYSYKTNVSRVVAFAESEEYSVVTGVSSNPNFVDTSQPPSSDRFIVGVIAAEEVADINDVADSGADTVVIQAYWDRLQPSNGALDAFQINALNERIDAALNRNLYVFFELAVQYPPAWVKASVPLFKDQDGVEWTGNPGEDIPDFVWTQSGRNAIGDFIQRVFDGIGSRAANIDGLRIGGGLYGEAQYPRVGGHPYRWWGFGDAPQLGTDLAADQTVCPEPGHVPYYGTPDGAADAAWLDWWAGGYSNYLLWQISQYRSVGYNGRIHVMHPSFGLRDNWDQFSWGYQEAYAQGVTWERQIIDYIAQDANTYPWSTWVDAEDPVPGSSVDSDKAAWRKLAELAEQYGKDDYLYGENTGGQSTADLTRILESPDGARQQGYDGLFWLNYSMLTGVGGASLTELASYAEPLETNEFVDSEQTVVDLVLLGMDSARLAAIPVGTGVNQATRLAT